MTTNLPPTRGHTELATRLKQSIQEGAGVPATLITDESSFDDALAMDSLSLAAVQVNIESALGVSISADELCAVQRFGGLVDVLAAKLGLATVDRSTGETVVSALEKRAAADQEIAIWCESLDAPASSITCAMLWHRARIVAHNLAAGGVHRGDRVVIVLPTGEDFPLICYGILLAGAAAVPIYPPASPAQVPEFLRSLRRVLCLTGSRIVVTTEFVADVLRQDREFPAAIHGARDLDAVATDAELAPVGPDDEALIQFSSGSTGDPRGISLSHGNIVSNIRAFQERVRTTPGDDLVVSWLPLYHDMGLIGTLLGSLVTEIPLVLASPQDFLRRPAFWLELLSRYRATLGVAPQFAFNLCTRRVSAADRDRLDLSTVRVLVNGAEPVQADAVDEFERTFAAAGLTPGVTTPCYGLAEGTLAVAMTHPGEPVRGRPEPETAVSVGEPVRGTELAIRAEGHELADGAVGEIYVRSPSVCRGRVTEHGLVPLAGADGWLPTHDVGCLAEGELYVVGRTKDLILAAGRNLYPQDLERAASDVAGVRAGRVVAFGVTDEILGTQAVVLAAETRLRAPEDWVRCASEIRRATLDRFDVTPRDVVLLPVGHIPLTSSGKLRRHQVKDAYQAGSFEQILFALQYPRPHAGTWRPRIVG